MSFHEQAQNVRVENNKILKAQLKNADGQFVDAEIDLDQFIGNDNGRFTWGAQGFSGSAENVTCSLEGAAGVPILRADLANAAGEKTAHDLNLGERIRNVNGQFQYE